jgi:hypothetical protein
MRRLFSIPVVVMAIVFGSAAGNLTALPQIQLAGFTGVLVDSACYAAVGKAATGSDHANCAIACAQKGNRLALVTAKGAVYMLIGTFAQANNAKLIAMLNQTVTLTGTVSTRVPDSPLPAPVLNDGRRPTDTQGAVVTTPVRKGDFREGDIPNASETTIDVTAIQLAAVQITL